MIIKWFIALFTIIPLLLMPLPLFAASDITVNFDVIAVSPVGATVRATITNFTTADLTKTINIVLSGMSFAAKDVKVMAVTVESYDVEIPTYGERPLTQAEIDAIKEVDPKATIPTTTLDVISTRIETRTREVKTDIIRYAQDQPKIDMKAIQTVKKLDKAVVDFQITTGVSWNGDKFINAGTLALMIDGKEYKDLTNSSWWNVGWEHRIKLTIDNTASAENLVNFPVLVKLVNGVNFTYADAQADLGDLRFIDADGTTVCDYEVELAGATSYVWVEVPQINLGVNTDYVYMYYGNLTVADGWNIAGTWNANYVAVYHMNDATTSTILDSKGVNNGAKVSANNPIQAASFIGYGQDFTADYITIGDNASLDLQTVTVEALVKIANLDAGTYNLVAKGSGNTTNYVLDAGFAGPPSGKVRFFGYDTTVAQGIFTGGGTAINNGNWVYLSGRFDGVNAWDIYQNTTADRTAVDAATLTQQNGTLQIGARGAAGLLTGSMDEIRISNVARSADWLEATYLSNTDAFITYAAADDMVQAPTNFTVTQTGADEVTLDWTAGTDATHTVIRGKDGGYPSDITDGYEVYNGVGITTTLTGLDINRMGYYYRAWGYNSTYLVYSNGYAQDFLGGDTMVYLLLGIVAAGLTIAMFTTKNSLLGFPSAIFWAILGAYAYTQSETAWGDWQYYLFFASAFGMTIFTALAAYSLREKRDSYGDGSVERNDEKDEDTSNSFEDIVKEPHDGVFDMGEDNPSRTTQRIRNRFERNKELRLERVERRRNR